MNNIMTYYALKEYHIVTNFQLAPVFTSFPKRVNRSLVPYDKLISRQKIKQNQERYKTLVMRRRLETKRVRTSLRK